jgi:hypothetical protein
MALEERNRYENLILLCEEHHHVVDGQVATYPVEKLRQMKYDHEALIAEAARRAVESRAADRTSMGTMVRETLYSSLLPVERLPRYIFSVECADSEKVVKTKLVRLEKPTASPLICRERRLYCFQNLRDEPGAFAPITKGLDVERYEAKEWWDDPDKARWYQTLLNRTLNKITGWRGLNLDTIHHRYFFQPDELGKPKSVPYRPMNVATSELQVVWQPVTKKTGLPKKFWYHRAIALQFIRTGAKSWCLALRPEMRVTKDGRMPLDSDLIGGKVTKKKSRMWNFDVLEELNFWREFLFQGRPHLIVPFGDFAAVSISANFLSMEVMWPGVPPERAKSYKNAEVEENLFTSVELDRISNDDDDDFPDEELEHATV